MKQIAIVGGGLSWTKAPWGDPAWSVYAHSSMYVGVKPREANLWFEAHLPEVRAEPKTWTADYDAWLLRGEDRTAPVVVQDVEPRPVNSIVLPRAEIWQWALEHGADPEGEYVTSTGVWMLLYALYQGATHIGIWGINYEEKTEYNVQRPCMEHWVGFARALRVPVTVTKTSRLGRDRHVYGYDGHREDLLKGHKRFRPGDAARLILVKDNKLPVHELPPAVQELVDEEREVYGVDTRALWAEALEKANVETRPDPVHVEPSDNGTDEREREDQRRSVSAEHEAVEVGVAHEGLQPESCADVEISLNVSPDTKFSL